MSREIIFRAKRKLNGDWVFGSYIYVGNDWCRIIESSDEDLNNFITVITDTVGQFTGLFDKNKKPIYEGDILLFDNNGYEQKSMIGWYETGFWLKSKTGLHLPYKIEIVGNIHDNPELLK